MFENEKTAPICAGSRACLDAFEQCLKSASHPLLGVRQYSNIEDQKVRFLIWTSNMAVFAARKFSLDHRLRQADDVQRLLLGMLEVLKGRISECATFISDLPIEQHRGFQTSLTQVHAEFETTTTALASQVGLFHEVANVIRKASRQTQNDIAASSFRITDDDGNDLEGGLRSHFLEILMELEQFSGSSSKLRERLAATMILRRRRILYRRVRYETTLVKPLQVDPEPANMPTDPIEATSQVYGTVKSATTLNPDNFRRAYSPSAVSSTPLSSIGVLKDGVFPLRPTPADSATEVTCPYCLHILHSREYENEARWRKHVLADLDSLVCLSDECDEPQVLYSHRKEWLRHMRKHTEHWRCTSKVHGLLKFPTAEDFRIHIKDDHKKSYTASQLEVITEKAVQYKSPLFATCPLCGESAEGENDGAHSKMVRHIVDHLRYLALKSLPPSYPETENDDDASSWSQGSVASVESGQASPSMSERDDKPAGHLAHVPEDDELSPYGQRLRQIHQPQMQQDFPPPPPREAIPADRRNHRPVFEVPDIRHDVFTESEMRRKLTDYQAVRFEKLPRQHQNDENDVQDEEVPRAPSWEKAIKTRVQGVSKRDLMDSILRLDMNSQDVMQKKAALSPALSSHLDIELENLRREDDDQVNYLWDFAQMDQQLQEVAPPIVMQHAATTSCDYETYRASEETANLKDQKRYWERVSLTVYFKRFPLPGVNIPWLYEITKRAQAMVQNYSFQQPIGINRGPARPDERVYRDPRAVEQHDGHLGKARYGLRDSTDDDSSTE